MTDIQPPDLDLIAQLEQLGADIDQRSDNDIDERVLAAIGDRPTRFTGRQWLVAAALLLVVIGVAAQPDSRRAIARWFGLDGVSVDVDPELGIGRDSIPIDPSTLVGPGESTVVDVDGTEVLFSALTAELDDILIGKTVASNEQIEEVTVGGEPGLWISGAAHDVLYAVSSGDVIVERAAADTLLWRSGDILYRVEGFSARDDALRFAESLDG